MGNQSLGRHAAFDQAWWCWRLQDRALTASAAISRPPGHDHPELRRDDIEPFGFVLADHMHGALAAGAGRALRLDDLFDPRQMRWQTTSIAAAFLPPLRGLVVFVLFVVTLIVVRCDLTLDPEKQVQLLRIQDL
jgi:hypothetical protein